MNLIIKTILDILGIVFAISMGAFFISLIFNKVEYNNSSTINENDDEEKRNLLIQLIKLKDKFDIKDYNSALAIADNILEFNPNNYSALNFRAMSLENLNYNLDAIDDYENLLKIDNSVGNIYGLLGLTYRKIGDLNNSFKNLEIAIEKGQKQYEMTYNLIQTCNDDLKLRMIENGNKPENLKRRKI